MRAEDMTVDQRWLRTPWRVRCPRHGGVCLWEQEYTAQMDQADATWMCPMCGVDASWDDDWYESFDEHELETMLTPGPKVGDVFVREVWGPLMRVVGSPVDADVASMMTPIYCEVIKPHPKDRYDDVRFPCTCYSHACTDGEFGVLSIACIHRPLTMEQFEQARANGWPLRVPGVAT